MTEMSKDMGAPPLVYVDLKKSKVRWPLKRNQPWYFVAINGRNMRRLARSTENYTNRADAVDAIWQLFANDSNVFLREAEHGNVNLRQATSGE